MRKSIIFIKLVMLFLILSLINTVSSAEVTYEKSATGRLVGDSPTELTKLLMSKGDIQFKSAGYYSSDLLAEAHQQPFNFYDEGDLATNKLDQLKQLFTDQLQSAFPTWENVESDMPVWKTSELLILEPLLDSFSYEYSNSASGINDVLWKNSFRKYKPIVVFDSDFAGLYLPKSADKGKSFVGSLGQDSTVIAPTAVPNRELVLALVCNLQLTNQQEQTLGRLLINTRNNYYQNSSGPSGLPLLSYTLYGLPNRTYSIPDQTISIDECYPYRKDTTHTTEISNKFTNQALFTNQSQSTADLGVNSNFSELSATITSTITDADYNIVNDGNYSFLKIKGFSTHLDFLALVSPRKVETIEFPLKTIITNYELVSLEDPVELTISDLPMYSLDGFTERICHDNNSDAGVNFLPSFTEDSLLILAEINPIEVLDCIAGKLRLYKKIKYKIDYIPSSQILIEDVQALQTAIPNSIVDVNILLKNITLNAVSGTLRIVDADANSILAEQTISGNANAVSMQFTAPSTEGMHLYRAEFLQNGEVKTPKEFWLQVKGLEAELLLPETARGTTKIQLLINNPFNYSIPISIKHSLIANDEFTEFGEISITVAPGESTAEWEYSRIYKEQQYYQVRAELEFEAKTKTLVGMLVSNNAPELASLQDIAVKEGEVVKIDINAFDLDNDPIYITISDPLGNDGFWQTDVNDAGIYTITVTASDGLLSDTQQFTITVIPIDKTPPNIEIYEPEARDYSYTRTLDITFDAIDVLSEIAYMKATLDGREIANNTELELNDITLGKHVLVVEAADTNGNAASKSVEFNVIDDIAPVSFASVSGNQKSPGIYTGKVIVELTASDGKSGIAHVEYNFDGNEEAFVRYTAPIEISDEGVTNLFYRAVDRAGNKELVKESKKLTNNTNSAITYGDPAWNPSTGNILFSSNPNGNYEIYSMSLDNAELQQLTSNSYNDFEPAVNADGNKIAFTSDRTGNEELWLTDLADNAEIQLTSNPNADAHTSWSSDGREIAFVSSQDDKNGIWIIDTYNNTQKFLLESLLDYNIYFSNFKENFESYSLEAWTQAKTVGWSNIDGYITADGISGKSLVLGTANLAFPRPGKSVEFKIKFTDWTKIMIDTSAISIVFWRGKGNGYLSTLPRAIPPEPPIWSIGTDPRQEQMILPSYYTNTTYAVKIAIADSDVEIYINNELKLRTPVIGSHPYSGKPYTPEITYINFGYGSDTTIIDDILLESSLEFSDPAFNPISNEIAFSYNFYGNKDIWLTSISESTSKQLTKSKSNDMHSSFNPLGNIIAYTSEEANNKDIWLINIDSNRPIRLTSDTSNEEMPSWNPNDNRILFISNKDGHSNIYLMELGKPLTIKIDNTVPKTLQTTDDAPLDWKNEDVVVNLNVDANNGAYTTYYRINDENTFHTGNQIILTETGYYVIFYYSQDAVMQEELKSTPLIKIDKIATQLTINSPIADANYLYTDILRINFNATDEISGIETIEALLDNNAVENLQMLNLQNMVGQHTFTLTATDKAGDKSTKTLNFNVIADNIAPETTDNAITGWTNSDVIVTLTATDNLSGVAKTFYSINSGAFLEGSTIALTETGEYAIDYYSIDNAGNVEQTKQTAKIQIDEIMPTMTISSPEARNYSYTADFTVQYSATDEISGIAGTSAEINAITVENNQIVWLFDYAIGKHTFAANAIDLANNSNSQSLEFNVIDDITPITTDNSDKEWHNSNIAITLTAEDEKSNVAAIYYIVNSGAKQIVNCSSKTCTTSVIIDYEDNNNSIEYWSIDEYGNIEARKIIDGIKLDKTAPQSSYEYDNLWHTANFTIPLSANDLQVQGIPSGIADVYYIIYNDEIPQGTNSISANGMPLIDYEDDDTRIEYYAKDIAGNEETHKFVQNIKLDKTAPLLQLLLNPLQETYNHNEPLPLQYSIEDPIIQGTPSGISESKFYLDGIEAQAESLINVSTLVGKHTIKLTATDIAGNYSETSIEFEVILNLIADQLFITPEVLNINPGVIMVHAAFPEPYANATIIDATLDGAPKDSIEETNIKFRRQTVEDYLVSIGEILNTHFEIRGTFQCNSQVCKFRGADDISAIEPDESGGKQH